MPHIFRADNGYFLIALLEGVEEGARLAKELGGWGWDKSSIAIWAMTSKKAVTQRERCPALPQQGSTHLELTAKTTPCLTKMFEENNLQVMERK